MKKVKGHSALLSKYSLMYEKNPRSRVFAPLAETYRKLGMIDESLSLLKEGIKNHPSYTLGYIVLGNCYYDRQNYEMAYQTVRPFVAKNLENITLQKLFAQTCINLGHLEEALQTFKYLLLLNPKDADVADQVKLLEDDLLIGQEDEEEIETKNIYSSLDEDAWVQVDFSEEVKEEELPIEKENTVETFSHEHDEIENWMVSSPSQLEAFQEEVKKDEIKVEEHGLDDKFFHEEYDNDHEDVIPPTLEVEDFREPPIITHTLVDLYERQGHFDKAMEILKNILELHPSDRATKNRLESLQKRLSDGKSGVVDADLEKLKIVYDLFSQALQKKAKEIMIV